MRSISDKKLKAILIESHEIINEQSSECASSLASKLKDYSLTYPPNGELGDEEITALQNLSIDSYGESGLAKVISSEIAGAFFHFFCVIDGVGDPRRWEDSIWLGVNLAEPIEEEEADTPMLHDDFYESYWDFKE